MSRRVTRSCIRADGKEVIGWENIELISDRPFKIWEDEFKKCKDMFPDRMLIASIMEEYRKDAWVEIVERCQACGVDAFRVEFFLSARFAGTQNGRGDGGKSRKSSKKLSAG